MAKRHDHVCWKNTPRVYGRVWEACDAIEYVFLHILPCNIEFLFPFDSFLLSKLESKCSMLVLLGFNQELDFPEDYYD